MNTKLVISGAVAAAIVVGAIAWSLSRGNPEDLLRRMIAAMSEVKSAHLDGTADLSGEAVTSLTVPISSGSVEPDGTPQVQKVTVGYTGDFDVHSTVSPLLKTLVSVDIPERGTTSKIGVEIRASGKKLFARLTDLPEHERASLGSVINQWVVFDPEEVGASLGLDVSPSEEAISEEQERKIRERAAMTKFFTLTRVLRSEKVEDVPTTHLAVKLNLPELRSFIIEAETIRSGAPPGEEDLEKIDELLAGLDDVAGELWIGRRDALLYRAHFSGKIREGNRDRGVWTVAATLTHHNEPAVVEAPGNARPLEELLPLLLGGLSGLPAAGEREAATSTPSDNTDGVEGSAGVTVGDGDRDGLTDELETFYGTDQANPDTDGDGMKDGDEVNAGRDPKGPGNLFEFGIGQ